MRGSTLRPLFVAAAISTLLTTLVACDMGTGDMGTGDMGTMDDDMGMPEDGLGGDAETNVLAEAELPAVPAEPLRWNAFLVSGVEHAHGPAFVHAQASTTVTLGDDDTRLEEGEAVFVPGGETHAHGMADAWDVILATADAPAPGGVTEEVFRSDELQGVPPNGVLLRTILVELPPGAETSEHSHPGSEFIHVTQGAFMYESGVSAEQTTAVGDSHTLPADTPVQKRNPDSETSAAFLSWFIVDADEPFAPEATLEG